MIHRHHLLFPRTVHEAHQMTKDIRRNQWLMPPLNDIGHSALHNAVILVPPLDRFTAGRVLTDFTPHRGDYMGSIYELMDSIEEAARHPRVRSIEAENAQVAIHALELQIPFIKEYLEVPNVTYT